MGTFPMIIVPLFVFCGSHVSFVSCPELIMLWQFRENVVTLWLYFRVVLKLKEWSSEPIVAHGLQKRAPGGAKKLLVELKRRLGNLRC